MKRIYEQLADLLEYPDANWSAKVDVCKHNLKVVHSEIAALLRDFFAQIDGLSLAQLQECYTQTFDLNPVCTLEVGYHLFGEDYKRGIFLANLRVTESPFELGQENQLPDYLPVLLRLLGKLRDEELRGDLISECLIPSLALMLAALKKAENHYSNLIAAISVALKQAAPQREVDVEAVAWRRHAALPVLQPNRF